MCLCLRKRMVSWSIRISSKGAAIWNSEQFIAACLLYRKSATPVLQNRINSASLSEIKVLSKVLWSTVSRQLSDDPMSYKWTPSVEKAWKVGMMVLSKSKSFELLKNQTVQKASGTCSEIFRYDCYGHEKCCYCSVANACCVLDFHGCVHASVYRKQPNTVRVSSH